MKILGMDSSGMTASVAYVADGVLIAEYTMNHKKTHSQTLLPMLDQIVRDAEIDLAEIDGIAIAAGPGSFTGLRIGAATVKGLGLALEKPVIPIPTCEGLAYNICGTAGLVVPIMDARRGQVYTGIYRVGNRIGEKNGESVILSEAKDPVAIVQDQDAMAIEELLDRLAQLGEPVTFLGDGVPVFRKTIEEKCTVPFAFAPAQSALQRASSVAALGEYYAAEGRMISADDMKPIYLRKSQAEREHEAAARARQAQDLETVAEMEQEMFSDAWSKDSLADSVKYPYNHILLISGDGNVRSLVSEEDVADSFVVGEEAEITAGYLIFADPSDEAELHRIAVLPEYRRRGLAKLLMAEMERRCGYASSEKTKEAMKEETREAAPQGSGPSAEDSAVPHKKIFLEVRAGNVPAIGLYAAEGFKEIDRRKAYYRDPVEDAVIMCLE